MMFRRSETVLGGGGGGGRETIADGWIDGMDGWDG